MSPSFPRSFGPSPTDPDISAAFVRAHEWARQKARTLNSRCNPEDIAQEVMFAINSDLRAGTYRNDDAGLRARVDAATAAAVRAYRRTDRRRSERDLAYWNDSSASFDAHSDVEGRYDSAERLARVRQRLGKLAGKHLQVFDLVACGFSYEEAASKLGLSLWTIRVYQHENLTTARELVDKIDGRDARDETGLGPSRHNGAAS